MKILFLSRRIGSLTNLLAVAAAVLLVLPYAFAYTTEDVYVPEQCDKVTNGGDHVLLEYTIQFANGTEGASLKAPEQLYHVLVDASGEMPVMAALKGMCKGAKRLIKWDIPSEVNLQPIFSKSDTVLANLGQGISLLMFVVHLTPPEDYKIFNHLRANNISAALDMVDEHKGVNAVDEWGQSPLMMAVQMQSLPMVAGLLNTRLPRVDINYAKSSGFTALFYAVEKASPTILSALLRRGADPNVSILQEGSRGNTPLHFACMLEKTKHAELLLEYGAAVDTVNQHGQKPQALLPSFLVPSTRLYFKKMFEEQDAKLKAASASKDDDFVLTDTPDL